MDAFVGASAAYEGGLWTFSCYEDLGGPPRVGADLLWIVRIRSRDCTSLDKGLKEISFNRLVGGIELHSLVSRAAIAHENGDLALGFAVLLLLALNFRSWFIFEGALEALGVAIVIPIAPTMVTCELST